MRADDRSILHVSGPVDNDALDELTAQLELSTTPGAPDLTIDLNHVTVLSSAAIHRIRASLDTARAAGVAVSLACRPGTLAHHVLTLAALPTNHDPAEPQ